MPTPRPLQPRRPHPTPRTARTLVVLASVGTLVTATACGSGKHTVATPTTPVPTTPASVAPSPSTAPPTEQLAALAAKARGLTYTGVYSLTGKLSGSTPARVTVGIATRAYEISILRGGHRSLFISNPYGIYSCGLVGSRGTCYQVGRAGAQPPQVFDPVLQHVFVDYPAALSKHISGYAVRAAASTPHRGSVPAARCFAVRATASAPKPAVTDGTYCLSDKGLFVSITYASGKLQLVNTGPAPSSDSVKPPVPLTPLPTATP